MKCMNCKQPISKDEDMRVLLWMTRPVEYAHLKCGTGSEVEKMFKLLETKELE